MGRRMKAASAALILLMWVDGAQAALRFGALGDSLLDEYQFIPDDRRFARSFVELAATRRGMDFGDFSLGSRGEPRRKPRRR